MKAADSGFSLVEVTIALGIMAFCIISIFGLLPVGLKSVKEAGNRRNAVEVMSGAAEEFLALRSGTTEGSNSLSGVFSNVAWELGGASVNTNLLVEFQDADSLRAWMEIVPPSDRWSPGLARISVAWPAVAQRSGDQWVNAQGSVSTVVYFNP